MVKTISITSITDGAGNPIMQPDNKGPFTVLDGFKTCVYRFMAGSPDEAYLAKGVNELLYACEGETLTLESAEFALLVKAVKAGGQLYGAVIWAQLLAAVDGAKEAGG